MGTVGSIVLSLWLVSTEAYRFLVRSWVSRVLSSATTVRCYPPLPPVATRPRLVLLTPCNTVTSRAQQRGASKQAPSDDIWAAKNASGGGSPALPEGSGWPYLTAMLSLLARLNLSSDPGYHAMVIPAELLASINSRLSLLLRLVLRVVLSVLDVGTLRMQVGQEVAYVAHKLSSPSSGTVVVPIDPKPMQGGEISHFQRMAVCVLEALRCGEEQGSFGCVEVVPALADCDNEHRVTLRCMPSICVSRAPQPPAEGVQVCLVANRLEDLARDLEAAYWEVTAPHVARSCASQVIRRVETVLMISGVPARHIESCTGALAQRYASLHRSGVEFRDAMRLARQYDGMLAEAGLPCAVDAVDSTSATECSTMICMYVAWRLRELLYSACVAPVAMMARHADAQAAGYAFNYQKAFAVACRPIVALACLTPGLYFFVAFLTSSRCICTQLAAHAIAFSLLWKLLASDSRHSVSYAQAMSGGMPNLVDRRRALYRLLKECLVSPKPQAGQIVGPDQPTLNACLPPLLPVPVPQKWAYTHGGYMGAAVPMLKDPLWSALLHRLMPDVHANAVAVAQSAQGPGAAIKALTSMFENNPVVAAYGAQNAEASGQGRPSIEWDVYLNPESTAEARAAPSSGTEHEDACRRLAADCKIGHGTPWNIVMERAAHKSQYAHVDGMAVPEWCCTFAIALGSARARHLPSLPPMPRKGPHAIAHAATLLRDWGSIPVTLDLKSQVTTMEDMRCLITGLNTMNVHVTAAGSFAVAQVAGLNALPQHIPGIGRVESATEVVFFHSAGGVQEQCKAGKIPPNTTCYFNIAMLVSVPRLSSGAQKLASTYIDAADLEALRRIKGQYNIKLGGYVQETDLSVVGARTIIQAMNANQALFDAGFAWGGSVGCWANDVVPSRSTCGLGRALQTYLAMLKPLKR